MSHLKKNLMELAVLGGQSAFSRPIHVGYPNVGNRDRLMERINDMLDRRWLTNSGPYVNELEDRIAKLLGVKHCIATCNGTVALELVIRALGLSGEVILPSFTFVATAHALRWQEIRPVFCDIDPQTYLIDPAKIEEAITPRTTGIIGVHLWGRSCDVDALAEIAERRNLQLFFDASHAFSCTHKGRLIGGFGGAEVFSFHATKFVNTFEGGAITTNNDDLARKIRLMKNFGFSGNDKVVYLGVNGKMSEISAAMGLTSLESMQDFIKVNQGNYVNYARGLRGIPGVRTLRYEESERNNYQYIALEIDEETTQIGRDALVEILTAENILARRYFYPGCHAMMPYSAEQPAAKLVLPNTVKAAARVIVLPTGAGVTENDIQGICGLIRFSVQNGSEIRKLMTARKAQLEAAHSR